VNRRTIRCTWLAAAAAFALTSCTAEPSTSSGSRSSAEPATSETAQLPTSTRSSSDERRHDAVAAYIAMWSDVAVAAVTSDWRSSRLGQHATGDALSTLSRAMYSDHRRGLVSKGEPSNDPLVSSATPPGRPTTVLVSDCGDSTRWLKYDARTGQVANDSPGGRRAISAEVKLGQDGTWRVTRFAVGGLGTC